MVHTTTAVPLVKLRSTLNNVRSRLMRKALHIYREHHDKNKARSLLKKADHELKYYVSSEDEVEDPTVRKRLIVKKSRKKDRKALQRQKAQDSPDGATATTPDVTTTTTDAFKTPPTF